MCVAGQWLLSEYHGGGSDCMEMGVSLPWPLSPLRSPFLGIKHGRQYSTCPEHCFSSTGAAWQWEGSEAVCGGRGLRRGKGRRQGNTAGGRGEGREEVEKSREKEGKGRRDEELGKKERRGERSRRGIEAGSGLPRAWQCSAHSPGWVNVCKTNQTELCPQRTQGTQPRSFRRGSSFRARCRQECPPSCWLMPITPQAAH